MELIIGGERNPKDKSNEGKWGKAKKSRYFEKGEGRWGREVGVRRNGVQRCSSQTKNPMSKFLIKERYIPLFCISIQQLPIHTHIYIYASLKPFLTFLSLAYIFPLINVCIIISYIHQILCIDCLIDLT